MAGLGVTSLGAYMRKVAIDAYIINLDMTEIRALITLLRRCSANLNQYARRANETGSVYAADIGDLRVRLDEIWRETNGILTALAGVK
uniref:Bacterial mobilisation domain-containing protein n=1 Tax=termite gut metagenome TaxID=433724 RepID=S0DDB2_9ZZZZ